MVTNHNQSYNRHAWMDTYHRVPNNRPDRASQNATAQSGACKARQSYPRMHKSRQAIPECSASMHWIKEAAEAQILRQAELHSAENNKTSRG